MDTRLRLYGKKFARRFVDTQVKHRTETRDAIIWTIDESTQMAQVRIQGSDTLVYAHFPRNWKRKPYWVRIGNSVRILHREGVRGYVEIIGEGRAIPTPVSGQSLPPEEELPDEIISGLELSETTPNTLAVNVTAGTYRIDGTVYYYTPTSGEYITMNDPAPMTMGGGVGAEYMGSGIGVVDIDPVPSSGYYRYDLLVVGTDSQLDYIAGTPSMTDPTQPDVPVNHLQVGNYILVKWSNTVISNSDIGAVFVAQLPSSLTFTVTAQSPATFDSSSIPYGFNWVSGETYGYANVKVEVKDQYGVALNGTYDMDLEFTNTGATGDLYSADSGWDNPSVSESFAGTYYTFQYRRNQGVTEKSPVFKATLNLVGRSNLQAVCFLVLNDISDNVILY